MTTVAVLGAAGGVGSVAAARVVEIPAVDGLLLVDPRSDLLAVQVMDLRMVAARRSPIVVEQAHVDAIGAADVILCAAGVPHRDGAARSAFAVENWRICASLLAGLDECWPGLFVMCANPVDVLTTLAGRTLGRTATVAGLVANDGIRLAQSVADVLGVPAATVEAPVLGEHGGIGVPLWDRVTVSGRPVAMTEHQRAAAWAAAERWYGDWQRHHTGRTSMWTTGLSLARLTEQWLSDTATRQQLSVSALGRFGIDQEVCVGLPTWFGAGGVTAAAWDLAADELGTLRRAADSIAGQVDVVLDCVASANHRAQSSAS